MGIHSTNGKRNRAAARFAEITRELAPQRAPWYVQQPYNDPRTPSMGWWWIPAGQEHPEYLGHNQMVAETRLLALRDAHYPKR